MKFIAFNSLYIIAAIILIIIILIILIIFLSKKQSTNQNIIIGNSQILGQREEQEDSFSSVVNKNGVLAIIADGMGGFSNGKLASSVTVNTFTSVYKKTMNIFSMKKFLIETTKLCNRNVLEKARGTKCGTTLVAAIISEGNLHWVSIGDSALVLYRNGELINLNKKHIFETVLMEQFNSGKISKNEVMNNKKKNRLTSYIGNENLNDIEISNEPLPVKKGDKILICSDGVYNSLSEIEIEKVLSRRISPDKAAEGLIKIIISKNNPKQDNATIIILKMK